MQKSHVGCCYTYHASSFLCSVIICQILIFICSIVCNLGIQYQVQTEGTKYVRVRLEKLYIFFHLSNYDVAVIFQLVNYTIKLIKSHYNYNYSAVLNRRIFAIYNLFINCIPKYIWRCTQYFIFTFIFPFNVCKTVKSLYRKSQCGIRN